MGSVIVQEVKVSYSKEKILIINTDLFSAGLLSSMRKIAGALLIFRIQNSSIMAKIGQK